MRKFLLSVVVAALLAGGLAAYGARRLYDRADEAYRGYESAEVFVDIRPGTSTPAIGRQLVASGVVRDETTFRIAVWRSRGANGEWRTRCACVWTHGRIGSANPGHRSRASRTRSPERTPASFATVFTAMSDASA